MKEEMRMASKGKREIGLKLGCPIRLAFLE